MRWVNRGTIPKRLTKEQYLVSSKSCCALPLGDDCQQKLILERWGIMTDTTDEGPIARGRRRALELSGEECLAAARLQAEQLIQNLDRKPSVVEKILLEEIAYLRVRVQRLNAWGQTRLADKAARLLANLLKDFKKEPNPTVGKLLEDEIQ
jgi:hypothetical protein